MILYHYSHEQLTEVSPNFFGQNGWTSSSRSLSSIPRSFWYLDPSHVECYFSNCKLYKAEVPDEEIMSFDFKMESMPNINIIQHKLAQWWAADVLGVKYTVGDTPVVVLFKPIKVELI